MNIFIPTPLRSYTGGKDAVDVQGATVAAALDALGGHTSPAGSCAWFVLGEEFSLRTWATRRAWCGKPIHGPMAQGVLVATLGTLAMHFGLTPRPGAA